MRTYSEYPVSCYNLRFKGVQGSTYMADKVSLFVSSKKDFINEIINVLTDQMY